jgi:malonate decarboxylase delta subunit
MEQLEFEFKGGSLKASAPVLVGVVSSGNLEVLIENKPLKGSCRVTVVTSVRGFSEIWRAVIEDFFARHPLADAEISINDAGATPAVVSLRLDQAIEELAC